MRVGGYHVGKTGTSLIFSILDGKTLPWIQLEYLNGGADSDDFVATLQIRPNPCGEANSVTWEKGKYILRGLQGVLSIPYTAKQRRTKPDGDVRP